MFGCVLSAGFDATVNARANRFTRVRGRARYPLAMMAELRRFDPLVCTLEVDGVRTTHDAMLIAIGNGSSYGGGMRICPDASLTDGWLDVTVVEEISVLELLRLFPTVYSGRHLQHPAARSYRGRSVTVEFTGDQLPPLFADGEPMSQHLAGGGCTAVVRPGALRLLTSRLT
jgi:diacylglycerol kinase (ATP)